MRTLARPAHLVGVAALIALPSFTAPSSGAAGATGPDVDSRVAFERPEARGVLGEPLTFRTELRSAVAPDAVELVTGLPGAEVLSVQHANVEPQGGDRYVATVSDTGHVSPDTTFVYRFRAVVGDEVTEGPAAEVTVEDARFPWRTLEGETIRLHWYEGDDAFARRALAIGDTAIERASDLLGASLERDVDFFIYAAEEPFREALGPATRENVGGRANPATGTLVGLIDPSDIESDWVDVLVAHELTHLVFAEAVENPYRSAPRWLNEGVAVHLSTGYTAGDRALVEQAARDDGIIPLSGLSGFFPTSAEGFALAYAQSVSAVDFFIGTYGEERLARLVRSYADGVSDDEAFQRATGADVAAFGSAWAASIGADLPEPYGPLPAPPGPVPPGWEGALPQPSPAAGASDAPTSPSPPGSGDAVDPASDRIRIVVLVWLVIAVTAVGGSLYAIRSTRRT